ncbi:MAG TPA: integrase arm-type DNA-binding domain-containing protein [Rhodanobacteraceae bacterium]|nr:integrase arm-type DNA-binding domain-containing protein [Rhodanobacteraceae bacterium]
MLTLPAVKNARPRTKPYKLADGMGLSLLVEPTGAKLWRYRFRYGGKESMLSFGAWPEVSIADARAQRDDARRQLREGVNPSAARKHARIEREVASGNTFHAVAADWIEANKNQWLESHKQRLQRSLDRDILPTLGDRPIADITAAEVLAVVRKVEKRDALDQAKRVLQRLTSIFALGVSSMRCPANPARELRGALKKAPRVTHRASLSLDALPDYFQRFDRLKADPVTRAALALLPLTVVRVSELVNAPWSEFDLDAALWIIPAERMKMAREHRVPLSRQAVEILRTLRAIADNALVFPSPLNPRQPLSINAPLVALRRMGYAAGELTLHGWRSTFSTWAYESGYDGNVIEITLAHVDKNAVRGAYNNATYMDKRRQLLQDWAGLLDAKRAGAQVIPIRRKRR